MNYYQLLKKSAVSSIEMTAARNKDIRLYRKTWIKRFHNEPIRFQFISSSMADIVLEINVRYGLDAVRITDKFSQELRTSLDKFLNIKVRHIRVIVKDVFDEIQSQENA